MTTVNIGLEIKEINSATGEITEVKFTEAAPRRFLDRMPHLDFRGETGNVEIILTVSDSTNNHLEFSSSPLWIARGKRCPDRMPTENTPFGASKDPTNARKLIVSSTLDGEEYRYRLNFINGQTGTGNYWLDPKILNGGSPPFVKPEDRALAKIVVGVVGAAIGALLTLAAIRLEMF